MPFQQLGFTPYPRSPRRDLSGYQNMGRGFAEIGRGAQQMLGAFQEMKERRQKNLMAQQQHDLDVEAKQSAQERKKYELELIKEDNERKKQQREMHQKIWESIERQKEKAAEMAEKERERQAKMQLEQMKFQSEQIPKAPAEGPQPKGLEGYNVFKGQPTPPPEIRQPTQQPPMTLEEYYYKSKALGFEPDPNLMKLMWPEADKAKRWYPDFEQEKELIEHKAKMQNMYKKFAPKSDKEKKAEDTPEGALEILESDIAAATALKKRRDELSKMLYEDPVFNFAGEKTAETKSAYKAKVDDLARQDKAILDNNRKIANSTAKLIKAFKKDLPYSEVQKIKQDAQAAGVPFNQALLNVVKALMMKRQQSANR